MIWFFKKRPDERDLLAKGGVRFRILRGSTVVDEAVPLRPEELRTFVEIPELGERAAVEFRREYEDFVGSGRTEASYAIVACRTIEKFGQAIQFKQEATLEFRRLG